MERPTKPVFWANREAVNRIVQKTKGLYIYNPNSIVYLDKAGNCYNSLDSIKVRRMVEKECEFWNMPDSLKLEMIKQERGLK